MELFARAVLDGIKAANNDLRKALTGLSGEGLNWRPTSEETNSLYVLATHMVGVQRGMVALAASKTIQRDRAAEFRATGDNVQDVLKALDRAEVEIEEWLDSMTSGMFAEPRTFLAREVPATTCLVYAVRHLGEHVGHAGLTRQLWEGSKAGAAR